MQKLTIKIPQGLVTQLAQERNLVNKYQTHRGFKTLAFYLLARTLTTSAGVYRGTRSTSRFNKDIAAQLGGSFNTINQARKYAHEFGFIKNHNQGFEFVAESKICAEARLYYKDFEIKYTTITLNPHEQSLEHILKTLVFGENFAKQEYSVLQKIKQIPGIKEKLSKYISNWQNMSSKELLKQVVMWQKQTFTNYVKGTEAYDLFHSIHADIALTCRRITEHFAFKSRQSSMYIKQSLSKLHYIQIEKREHLGNATRKPHEPDGACKPITLVWLSGQMQRKWVQPDLITLNLKNL